MTTIVQTKRTATVTTSYDVTGAEPMRADWSERIFVPERVVITDCDGNVTYHVTGVVLKKDGTPSLNHAHHRPYRLVDLGAEPEWLQNLIRNYCAQAGIEVTS